ncbi:MAG: 23S rRNA (adenine(2503)-C(2))-methyltransferase RlmN [Thermodesulfobacteriota bacterium]
MLSKPAVDIKILTQSDLEDFVSKWGQQRYRASHLIKWLYQKGATNFHQMTDLSKTFRETLCRVAFVSTLTPNHIETSRDGTKKFLFPLMDGNSVESVLVPDGSRLTLCISTQVGCPLGCRFCLSGSMGFVRDLTTSEILNQILAVQREEAPKRRITNIVLMGMGEPLANYANTVKAIEMMQYDGGLGFSGRRITLSTSGLVPEMERLMATGLRFQLAVSLNAADDDTRSFLMPVNKSYPLNEVLESCRRFRLRPRERIIFEYVLIDGINDSSQDALRLVHLLKGIPCKVNLIPFNESSESEFTRPDEKRIHRFQMVLLDRYMTCIVRKSRGGDIWAACGQLKGTFRGFLNSP